MYICKLTHLCVFIDITCLQMSDQIPKSQTPVPMGQGLGLRAAPDKTSAEVVSGLFDLDKHEPPPLSAFVFCKRIMDIFIPSWPCWQAIKRFEGAFDHPATSKSTCARTCFLSSALCSTAKRWWHVWDFEELFVVGFPPQNPRERSNLKEVITFLHRRRMF